MQMRGLLRHIVSCSILLAMLAGCQRIPLYERATNVSLRISLQLSLDYELEFATENDLDEELSLKVYGKEPQYFMAMFYDKYTHDLTTSHIVGAEGGDLHVPSGEYDIVLYNFGTESTQVRNLNIKDEAEAFTSDITKTMSDKFMAIRESAASKKSPVKGYEDDPIIHEPDHLYVANVKDADIPAFTGKDVSVTIYADAASIVEVYSLEILNLKGVENIGKVEVFITGQSKSNHFGRQEMNPEPASIYTEMRPDKEKGRLYTIFGTFGKLPGEEGLVYLDISDTGGGKYRYIYDVTDQFDDPENTGHRLVVDASEIDIPKPEHGGGGLAPSVDKWENEEVEVPLG